MGTSRRVLSIDVGATHYAVCAVTFQGGGTLQPCIDYLDSWYLGDVKAVPASRLVDRLVERMTGWEFLQTTWQGGPSTILIEQQMRGAHVNVALAFSTYSLFRVLFPSAETRFVPPLAKFTVASQTYEEAVPKGYQARKRFAIKTANRILQDLGLSSLADRCPGQKQDDLADAFLQAFVE